MIVGIGSGGSWWSVRKKRINPHRYILHIGIAIAVDVHVRKAYSQRKCVSVPDAIAIGVRVSWIAAKANLLPIWQSVIVGVGATVRHDRNMPFNYCFVA